MRNPGRAVAVVVAVAATAAVLAALGSGGHQPTIATHAQRALLRLARKAGQTNGDANPYDIEAVHTTYRLAQAILGGSSDPSPPANEPVYLVAMRGRFNPLVGFVPTAKAQSSPHLVDRVLEAMFIASSLQMLEDEMGRPYPKLLNVVRIG